MGNQSGQPERGEITGFQDPNPGQLKPVAVNSTTLIEGLFTSKPEAGTGTPAHSKAEMLRMALHPAEKAA